jgi:hypothetical protein
MPNIFTGSLCATASGPLDGLRFAVKDLIAHCWPSLAIYTRGTLARTFSSGASMHNLNSAGSTRGMVTSPHALASEAGRDVLRTGGNAI